MPLWLGVSERAIDRFLAERPRLDLEPGRCVFGHLEGSDHSRGYDYEYHTIQNEVRGVLCSECGSWYLNPRPGEDQFSVIYPEGYAAYEMTNDSGRGASLAFRAKAWLERRKIRRYAKFADGLVGDVLDVGCGDGLLLDGFRREGFPMGELVGVDFHPRAVELTRAKGYRVLEGPIEHVDLGEPRYRLIVMNQLIEHLVDPLSTLEKLRKHLVPGGYLFLETPNVESPNARLCARRYWGGYHYPRHLHLFSPGTLTRALEHAGLEAIESRYLPCPVQWILTLNNYLQERRRPGNLLLRLIDWRNPFLLALFTLVDLLLRPLGTANMQVVARR